MNLTYFAKLRKLV